jgi:hypothetical protein
MLCAPEQDLRGGVTTQQERLAKEARAAEISDHGGDSACWAHLLCPECGAISSEGDHRGCESEQVRVSNGSVANGPSVDGIDECGSHGLSSKCGR